MLGDGISTFNRYSATITAINNGDSSDTMTITWVNPYDVYNPYMNVQKYSDVKKGGDLSNPGYNEYGNNGDPCTKGSSCMPTPEGGSTGMQGGGSTGEREYRGYRSISGRGERAPCP